MWYSPFRSCFTDVPRPLDIQARHSCPFKRRFSNGRGRLFHCFRERGRSAKGGARGRGARGAGAAAQGGGEAPRMTLVMRPGAGAAVALLGLWRAACPTRPKVEREAPGRPAVTWRHDAGESTAAHEKGAQDET